MSLRRAGVDALFVPAYIDIRSALLRFCLW